jgi:hypothetical protein
VAGFYVQDDFFFNRRRGSSLAARLSDYVLVKAPNCRNYLTNDFGKKGQLQSDLTGLNIFTTQTHYKALLYNTDTIQSTTLQHRHITKHYFTTQTHYRALIYNTDTLQSTNLQHRHSTKHYFPSNTCIE